MARFIRWATSRTRPLSSVLCLLLMALIAVAGGCASKEHAGASTLRLTEQEEHQRLVLDRRDQARIRAAFAAIAEGHRPVEPPRAAPMGVRWSDVELAAKTAVRESEMGVFGIDEVDDRYVFHLRTADDRPAQLLVERTSDDHVYQASAWVGRFRDDAKLAEKLLSEFDKAMKAFGSKRKLPNEDD